MEPKVSLSYSQDPTTCSVLRMIKLLKAHFFKLRLNIILSFIHVIPTSGLSPSAFETKILNVFAVSLMRPIFPIQFVLLDLVIFILLWKFFVFQNLFQ